MLMQRGGSVRDELQGSFLTQIFNARNIAVVGFAILFLVLLIFSGKIFETTSAGWYVVKQAAGSGTLSAKTEPGMFIQGFGDVFKYKAADTVADEIDVRFNDGAKAKITVNTRVELPNNPEALINLHSRFRSYDAVIRDSVHQVMAESVILTAALMSAEESYTTKRAEFSQMSNDQVANGVYLTEADVIQTKDPKTGEVISKSIVNIQKDPKTGLPLRKEAILDDYGIRLTQFVIKDIDYEDGVDGQIAAKQQALQAVVSSKAEAEKAQQLRITTEEQGKADVAKARYEKEVEKIRAVTDAEQKLEVSRLDRQAAEQYKQTKILQAEGDAEYRRKIMVADGALEIKVKAWVEVEKARAEALAKMTQPVVPGVVMGQAGQGSSAADWLAIMGAKSAKDLMLDMKPKGQGGE